MEAARWRCCRCPAAAKAARAVSSPFLAGGETPLAVGREPERGPPAESGGSSSTGDEMEVADCVDIGLSLLCLLASNALCSLLCSDGLGCSRSRSWKPLTVPSKVCCDDRGEASGEAILGGRLAERSGLDGADLEEVGVVERGGGGWSSVLAEDEAAACPFPYGTSLPPRGSRNG